MPGVHLVGRFGLQPAGHLPNAGDLRPRVAVVLAIRIQLRKPARHLPFQEALRLAEVGQPNGDMVDGTQLGQRVGHRQPHAEPHRGITGMQRRQPLAGIESIDRLHQVEDGITQHARIVAGGNQMWVRHVGIETALQGLWSPAVLRCCCAPAGAAARVAARTVEKTGEPQHDVLGSAGDTRQRLPAGPHRAPARTSIPRRRLSPRAPRGENLSVGAPGPSALGLRGVSDGLSPDHPVAEDEGVDTVVNPIERRIAAHSSNNTSSAKTWFFKSQIAMRQVFEQTGEGLPNPALPVKDAGRTDHHRMGCVVRDDPVEIGRGQRLAVMGDTISAYVSSQHSCATCGPSRKA